MMSLLHLFPKRRKENDKEFQLWPVLRFFGVCKCKIFAQFSKHVGLDWESNAVTEMIKKTNGDTLNMIMSVIKKRDKNDQSYHQDHTSLTGFNA